MMFIIRGILILMKLKKAAINSQIYMEKKKSNVIVAAFCLQHSYIFWNLLIKVIWPTLSSFYERCSRHQEIPNIKNSSVVGSNLNYKVEKRL